MRASVPFFSLAALAFAATIGAAPVPLTAERLTPVNRTVTVDSSGVVQLDTAKGDGIAWLRDAQLAEGRISVEVRGLDKPGASFVGVAFHGKDDREYDAVYLRPFNFNAADPVRRAHAVQYVSHPAHTWSKLREQFPGKYEAGLDPAPAAGEWVRLTLEIRGREVRVFVADGTTPALTVQLLNERGTGRVGLWVGNDSAGWFRGAALRER